MYDGVGLGCLAYVNEKGRLPAGAVRNGREGGWGAGGDGQWGARRIRRVLVTFAVPANRALGRKLTPTPHPRGNVIPRAEGWWVHTLIRGWPCPPADAGRRLDRARRSLGCEDAEGKVIPVSGEGPPNEMGPSPNIPGTFTKHTGDLHQR